MTDDLPLYVLGAVIVVALICAVVLFVQTWSMVP